MEALTKEMQAVVDSVLAKITEEKKGIEAWFQSMDQKTKGFEEAQTGFEMMRKRLDEVEAFIKRPSDQSAKDKGEFKSLGQQIVENDDMKRVARDGRGKMVMNIKGGIGDLEQKTLIDTAAVGRATPGILNYARLPDIIKLQSRTLRVRDVLPVYPLSATGTDYVKENVFTNAASPQGVDGTAKAESALTFTIASAIARTIAHWMPASKQILQDFPQLRAMIDFRLLYGLKLKEETEILSGDGLGEHLNGIITQATAYLSGTYNVSGDTKLDKLRHAILQARVAEYPTDVIFANPVDVHTMELIKDETGGANKGVYVVGDPITGRQLLTIWGRPVIETNSITSGTFLIGSALLGAGIFDRMEATIEVSTEHANYFTENKVAVLCEERIALAVFRPASWIYGSY